MQDHTDNDDGKSVRPIPLDAGGLIEAYLPMYLNVEMSIAPHTVQKKKINKSAAYIKTKTCKVDNLTLM